MDCAEVVGEVVAEVVGDRRRHAGTVAPREALANLPRLGGEAYPLKATVVAGGRRIGAEDVAHQAAPHGRIVVPGTREHAKIGDVGGEHLLLARPFLARPIPI